MLKFLLAFGALCHALPNEKRAFTVTQNNAGDIPSSLLPTSTMSVNPTQTPVSSYDSNALASLWSLVETTFPVQVANVTSVADAEDVEVPDTPLLPLSLQDHAGDLKFPEGFLFGVASAATQYEGGVKADGRGPSNWDYLCHTMPSSCNNYTSDITDNGRYLYKQDIARMKALGFNVYSFTISWTRVVPFGVANSTVSQEGLNYYSDLVDTLINNGIKPVITLNHWDLPLNLLFSYGGFLNESITNDFLFFAETVFAALGDRVTSWITFNEPRVYCSQYTAQPYPDYYHFWSYATLNATTAAYPCSYNLLKTHGKTVQLYRRMVSEGKIKSGEIAIKNDDSYPIPKTNSTADQTAAERHFNFYIGIFSEPIYGSGSYPDAVRQTIPEYFLPNLSSADQALIKGSADFYAIDGYRTNIASALPDNSTANCLVNITHPAWPVCENPAPDGQYALESGYTIGPFADPNTLWLYNAGAYVRRQFKLLKQAFNFDKIYLSEFGFSDEFGYLLQYGFEILSDSPRVAYYNDYLAECLKAIHEDGIPLAGTFAWSIVDNFEWNSGMNQRFGIQFVNFTTQERQFKLSALTLRDFGKNHLSN